VHGSYTPVDLGMNRQPIPEEYLLPTFTSPYILSLLTNVLLKYIYDAILYKMGKQLQFCWAVVNWNHHNSMTISREEGTQDNTSQRVITV
jgi:hypothetical protein